MHDGTLAARDDGGALLEHEGQGGRRAAVRFPHPAILAARAAGAPAGARPEPSSPAVSGLEAQKIRRAPGKLKYLAGSESAMGVFINDVRPEHAARLLREVSL